MASQGPQPEQQLIHALYNYLIEQAHAAPKAVAEGLEEICAKGDILCEMSEGNYHLLPFMSNIIAQAEEKTGISRYISGPIALVAVGGIIGLHLYKKYNVKSIYDNIRQLITAEFGASAIATELFNTFKKSIEDAVDEKINEFMSKYANVANFQTNKEKVEMRQRFLTQMIDTVTSTLSKNLKDHKATLTEQATKATDTVSDAISEVLAQKPIPGLQQSAATVTLPSVAAKSALQAFIKHNFIESTATAKKTVCKK